MNPGPLAHEAAPAGAAPHELALWQRLRAQDDPAARSELLALHLPYARVVAASLYARRYHDDIEFADYLQYANVGLLECVDRYDPARGAQFRTFASRRMHGAILNGIERLTEKQQQITARQRLQAERLDRIKAQAHRHDADGPLPASPEPPLFRYVAEVGIGLALAWLLDGTGMVEDAERSESVPFYRDAAVRQVRQRLDAIVGALPAQERLVVRSHYQQQMRFDEIAQMLHLTKGRISQIHAQAMRHLREAAATADLDCTA
ncbi:MAG TPA: sigma-70 family RNA polymerase sigma factor [Ramlibacter sp.]|jgi:RNA polymerase sigma factor for flagellar operon FliA|uniref:sigma-70 family RNA polymerase sigma factor n=1 Tax=Ramlibacter sp. TaxID=1917967 RepID=UPI002D5A7E7B|nr:sigma-70 family RNA polymerase sigma factor [Ramlibacter sp.]HZY18911.1 sigma-70 family RNA polymerase sigma factor [Ramlibacter sp.]